MSDDFEKNISRRMDGFKLTPGPQVWERVAAALPEKRRRRIAIWWWLPLAACLGGGIWLMVDKQPGNNKKIITGSAEQPSAEYSGTGEKLLKQAPGDTAKNNAVTHQQTVSIIEKKNSNQPSDNRGKEEVIISKKESVANRYSGDDAVALQAFTAKAKRNIAIAETEWPVAKKQSSVNEEPLENITLKLNAANGNIRLQMLVSSDSFLTGIPILPVVDLAVNQLATTSGEKDSASLNKTDTLVKTVAEIKLPPIKINSRKAEWGLVLAIGRSNLSSNNKSQESYLRPSSLSNYGGQSTAVGPFNTPTAGIAVTAGIVRTKTLSKHITWDASVSYQLLTAKQRTGSRNDSLTRFNALADAAFYTTMLRVGNSPGQAVGSGNSGSSNQLNKVHRIQLTNGIRYTINPKAESPLGFSAGASVAYNINNKVLLHDYRSFSYIRSNELSNKLMWGGEIGLDVYINHKIKAGVFYQHDFTNVGRPKVISVFRWNQLQLRVGIPLSKH